MTKFKIYKLRFTSPLHIGDKREDYGISLKTINSDSLYAAITAVLAKIGKKIPSDGELGFTISSLFPYYENNNEATYFLPNLRTSKIPNNSLLDVSKKIKKIEWLDIQFFNKLINGVEIFTEDFDKKMLDVEKYLTYTNLDGDFIESYVYPRVSISRDYSEDAKPFYMDRLFFKDDSGLYFIAVGKTKLLETALEILKDQGIGTDRTVGNGFFEWSDDEIEIDIPESNFITNLSLFHPENEMQFNKLMDNNKVVYDFQKRGGWITDEGFNTLRKNTVRMFSEASLFFKDSLQKDFSIMGDIVDLKPDVEFVKINHPIWRNGKSIFIPVKI
jgi:CRISPR-associated protein Csm4